MSGLYDFAVEVVAVPGDAPVSAESDGNTLRITMGSEGTAAADVAAAVNAHTWFRAEVFPAAPPVGTARVRGRRVKRKNKGRR